MAFSFLLRFLKNVPLASVPNPDLDGCDKQPATGAASVAVSLTSDRVSLHHVLVCGTHKLAAKSRSRCSKDGFWSPEYRWIDPGNIRDGYSRFLAPG